MKRGSVRGVLVGAATLGAAVTWLLAAASTALGLGFTSHTFNSGLGSQPDAVAIGNLNGDGTGDLAYADYGSNDLNVVFSGGGGCDLGVGKNPYAIAVGDLNGDTHRDLAIANYGGDNVTVLLNGGPFCFTQPAGSPFTADTQPESVAIGNLNGDGHRDIVTANYGANDATILLGDGTGGFPSTESAPAGTHPVSVGVGKLNGDAFPDLAFADNASHGKVKVLLGDGLGGFTEAAGSPFAAGSFPASVAIGDLNGDGHPDLAVANAVSDNVTVLLGDGSGGFTEDAGSPFAVGSDPSSVAIGDLNGDGRRDLAVANYGEGDVTVLLGNGAGGFKEATGSPFKVGTGPASLAIGDLNGDGRADLATANSGSDTVTELFTKVPPPHTEITKAKIRSRKGKATFRFDGSGGVPPLEFRCALDHSLFEPCSSPKTYRHLDRGRHLFEVEAVDSRGKADPTPAKKRFKVR